MVEFSHAIQYLYVYRLLPTFQMGPSHFHLAFTFPQEVQVQNLQGLKFPAHKGVGIKLNTKVHKYIIVLESFPTFSFHIILISKTIFRVINYFTLLL